MSWWTKELPNTVVTRKEARSLSSNEEARISAAYMKMRENKNGAKGTSEYFRCAVMHGGFPGLSRNEYPEYCCHGKEAFGAWHRPYLLEFERAMRRADMALGNDGNIGLPYWDWSVVKNNGQVMPSFVRNQLMKEFDADFFPDGADPNFVRGFLMSNTASDARIEGAIGSLGGQAFGALNIAEHGAAVCTKWQDGTASLESPHNMVHGVVGGIMGAFQSSFHPVFWMHHNNIDRFYEGYIKENPDSATDFENHQKSVKGGGQAGFPEGPWGPYMPFKHPRTGAQFHARDCFGGTDALGYSFDDIPKAQPLQMREQPFLAFFRQVDIHKLGQCRMVYVFVHDKSKQWTPPAPNMEAMLKHDGFAGQKYIFFAGKQHCRNCMDREPFDMLIDVTPAMRKYKVSPSACELKVMVENQEDGAVVDISATPLPVPVLKGPKLHTLEGATEQALKEFRVPEVVKRSDYAEKGLKATRGQRITWSIKQDTLPASLKINDVIADIEKAWNQWAEPTGLKFEMVEACDLAKLVIQWSIDPLDYEAKFDGPGGKLGEGDGTGIIFDGSERWEAGTNAHPQRKKYSAADSFFNPFFKLYNVALHEMGHVLGLDHSSESGDVMLPFYDEKSVTLSENDKKRAQAMIDSASGCMSSCM